MLGNCTGRRHLAFLKSDHRAAFLPSPKRSCWQQFTQECPSAGSPSQVSSFLVDQQRQAPGRLRATCSYWGSLKWGGRAEAATGPECQVKAGLLGSELSSPEANQPSSHALTRPTGLLLTLLVRGCCSGNARQSQISLLPWADSLDLWLWASLTALHVSVHPSIKMARHNKTQQQRGNMLYKSNTLF